MLLVGRGGSSVLRGISTCCCREVCANCAPSTLACLQAEKSDPSIGSERVAELGRGRKTPTMIWGTFGADSSMKSYARLGAPNLPPCQCEPQRSASGASPRRTVAESAQSLLGHPAAPSPAPTRPAYRSAAPSWGRIGSAARPKMLGYDDLRLCGNFGARCQPRPGQRASASEPCGRDWGSPCRTLSN